MNLINLKSAFKVASFFLTVSLGVLAYGYELSDKNLEGKIIMGPSSPEPVYNLKVQLPEKSYGFFDDLWERAQGFLYIKKVPALYGRWTIEGEKEFVKGTATFQEFLDKDGRPSFRLILWGLNPETNQRFGENILTIGRNSYSPEGFRNGYIFNASKNYDDLEKALERSPQSEGLLGMFNFKGFGTLKGQNVQSVELKLID